MILISPQMGRSSGKFSAGLPVLASQLGALAPLRPSFLISENEMKGSARRTGHGWGLQDAL